jgi:cobalamin biosynthesis protein CobD/CbiB
MVQDDSRRSTAKKAAVGVWVFAVLLSTVFLVLGGMNSDTLGGIWLGVLACFWLTMGATFLINHITNQCSHAVLGELEALKQSVQELQKLVEARRE